MAGQATAQTIALPEGRTLLRRIRKLRNKLLRLALLRGLAITAVCSLVLGWLFVLLDYQIRFADPGWRVLLWLLWTGSTAWCFWRWIGRPIRFRWNELCTAWWLEHQYPQLKDRLVAAVEFLLVPAEDLRWGSPQLRQATIHSAARTAQHLDFESAINPRPVASALLLAAGAVLLWIATGWLNLAFVRVGIPRLLYPFCQVRWPNRYQLVVVNPVEHVALGSDFQLLVVDAKGIRPPDNARIGLRSWTAFGTPIEQWIPMQLIDANTASRLLGTDDPRLAAGALFFRRANITSDFQYRVVGGDDQTMPWTTVRVVFPPRLRSIQATIIPPQYSGLPRRESPPQIEALAGSHVQLRFSVDRAVRAAILVFGDGKQLAAVAADETGRRWQADFLVEQSGSYRLELVDALGIRRQSPQWPINVVADSPPSVSITRPKNRLFVTPTAEVPIAVQAEDDLALKRVSLEIEHRHNNAQQFHRIEIYPRKPSQEHQDLAQNNAPNQKTVELTYRLAIADLQAQPGARLVITAVASDHKPNLARSDPRELWIVADEELLLKLSEQESALLQELARALQMERQVHDQTAQVATFLQANQLLRKPQLDLLKGAQLNQQQINSILGDSSQGIFPQVALLFEQLQANNLTRQAALERLQMLVETLARLNQDHLPQALDTISEAAKLTEQTIVYGEQTRDTDGIGEQIRNTLASAEQHQLAIIKELEQLLDRLGFWHQLQRLQAAWAQLAQEQKNVLDRTRRLALDTLGRSSDQLTDRQKAQLAELSRRQDELARNAQRLLDQMADALAQLQGQPSARPIEKALQFAEQASLTADMPNAAELIRRNQLGQATVTQQTTLEKIQQLLQLLAADNLQAEDPVLQQLQATADQLRQLQQGQQEIEQELREAMAIDQAAKRRQLLQQLADRQQKLLAATGQLAEQLEQVDPAAAALLREATTAMNQAAAAARADAAPMAQQAAKQAVEKLREAARALGQAIAEQATRSLLQRAAAVLDRIQQLRDGQAEVLDTLHSVESSEETLPDQLAAEARRQDSLRSTAQLLAEQTEQFPAIRMALLLAASHMEQTSQQLRHGRLAEAIAAAQLALETLENLLQAFSTQPPSQSPKQQPSESEPSSSRRRTLLAAQLRVVKVLQEAVNARTAKLQEQLARENQPSAELEAAFAELTHQQAQIARVLLQLIVKQAAAVASERQASPEKSDTPENKEPSTPTLNEP